MARAGEGERGREIGIQKEGEEETKGEREREGGVRKREGGERGE